MRWRGFVLLYVAPCFDLPREGGGADLKRLSLGGSIKNHINIHDVYQSKSWISMYFTLLIVSQSRLLWFGEYHLERLTSVGRDLELLLSSSLKDQQPD